MKQLLGNGYDLDKLTNPGEYAITGPTNYRREASAIHIGVGHLANGQLYQQAIEYPIDANWQFPMAPVWVRTRGSGGNWGLWVLGPVVVGEAPPIPEPEGLSLYLSSPESHTQNDDAVVKWAGTGFLVHPGLEVLMARDSSFASAIGFVPDMVVDDHLLEVTLQTTGDVIDSYIKLRASDGTESNVMRFSWTA